MILNNDQRQHKENLAFIVGNGINRFDDALNERSWETLLIDLWSKCTNQKIPKLPQGISNTEFFDLLLLRGEDVKDMRSKACEETKKRLLQLSPKAHHKHFMEFAQKNNAPVLTTNYDLLLPKAIELKEMRTIAGESKNQYYPWSSYYSNKVLNSPTEGFGIWYINGLITYKNSMRLGLADYIGAVQKARGFIQTKSARLYGKEDHSGDWAGSKTWLTILFAKSLIIFGLALEENELLLRWLLLERAKYIKSHPEKNLKGWYVTVRPPGSDERYSGKKKFLNGVGFEVREVSDHKDIYDKPWR